LKYIHYCLFLLFFFLSQFLQAQTTILSNVNPLNGTGGQGNAFPGAVVPFGMVQLGPDNVGGEPLGSSGDDYAANSIAGFSHVHLRGSLGGDGLDISVMPLLAPLAADEEPRPAKFDHRQEKTSPGYYAVQLDNGINVELTTTERVGYHRYHFPENSEPTIRFDLAFHHAEDLPTETFIQKLDDSTLVGYRYSTGLIPVQRVYFAARTAVPIKRFMLKDELQIETGAIALSLTSKEKGKGIAAQLVFDPNAIQDAVEMKVALSMTSTEKALDALQDVPLWNFNAIRARAVDKWEKELKKVQVKTKDENLKQIFYTALYHTAIFPALVSDRGDDTIRYTFHSLNTSYNTLYPLFAITQPTRYADMLHSLVYTDTSYVGSIPPRHFAIPILADALLKNWPGLDRENLYDYLKKSATEKRQDDSATSLTSYYDYCVAQLAEKLGKKGDYAYFSDKAAAYHESIEARKKTTFSVLHDISGLAKLYGEGRFEQQLDSFYSVSPAFVDSTRHIAYMYNFLGKPWKTQRQVRRIVDSIYHVQPEGYMANEDVGEMSAWAVWSILGLYPVNPAGGEYVFGSPLVDEAIIQLKDRKTLTIIAKNNSAVNSYIQSLALNGNPYKKSYIDYSTLMQGGRLVFEMGPEPNKEWGKDEAFRPSSMRPTTPAPAEETRKKESGVLEWIRGIFKNL